MPAKRPLGRYVEARMEEEDWTYDDLVRNADRQGIKVSPELFRRARKDDFVQPLREASVEKLAAGLLTTKDHIRDLDFAFWRPTNEAPDPEDEIRYQRPAGISDREWERLRRAAQGTLRALFEEYET